MGAARAGLFGFMAACALVAVVVTALPEPKVPDKPAETASTPPSSDTVHFDRQDAIHKAQLDQIEAGAGVCMGRATHGLLMQGERNRPTLLRFAVTNCGAALKRFLVSLGTPAPAADAYVEKTAEDVLAIALQ